MIEIDRNKKSGINFSIVYSIVMLLITFSLQSAYITMIRKTSKRTLITTIHAVFHLQYKKCLAVFFLPVYLRSDVVGKHTAAFQEYPCELSSSCIPTLIRLIFYPGPRD